MAKIENVQFLIPVTGQSYTDVRPVISGESWDDIRQTASEIAYGVGNTKMGEILSSPEKRRTEAPVSSQRMCFGEDCAYFDEASHTYTDEDGNEYLSGSTFAHMFEKEFPRESIAVKTATKREVDPAQVLEGWDSKGQVSLLWGTTIHKAIETKIKYDEEVNDSYLASLVADLHEQLPEKLFSEVFVCDNEERLCGFIDCLVQIDGKDCEIYDWKTGDIYKKTSLNDLGRELFPDFKQQTFSLYILQLNFYRYILEKKGYNVKGMKIWALGGEHWTPVEVPKVEINNALEAVWKSKK